MTIDSTLVARWSRVARVILCGPISRTISPLEWRMHAGVSCLWRADNCHVKGSGRCIKLRQSASGTRSLKAGQAGGLATAC